MKKTPITSGKGKVKPRGPSARHVKCLATYFDATEAEVREFLSRKPVKRRSGGGSAPFGGSRSTDWGSGPTPGYGTGAGGNP